MGNYIRDDCNRSCTVLSLPYWISRTEESNNTCSFPLDLRGVRFVSLMEMINRIQIFVFTELWVVAHTAIIG